MAEQKQEITAFTLWSQTLETMRKGAKDSFFIGFIFLVLPSLCFTLFARGFGHKTVTFMRETTDKMLSGSLSINYRPLYDALAEFATFYLVIMTLMFSLLVISFSAFNFIALEKLEYYKSYGGNLKLLVKRSIKASFPSAFVILLVAFLFNSERALLGPVRLFSLLSLVAFCINVTEKRGALSSIWSAVTLKFISNKKGLGFSVLWLTFSTGALLYLSEYFFSYLIESLGSLSKINKSFGAFVSYRPGFLPCTIWKLFLDSLYFVSYLFLFVFVVNFTSCLYVQNVKSLSEKK